MKDILVFTTEEEEAVEEEENHILLFFNHSYAECCGNKDLTPDPKYANGMEKGILLFIHVFLFFIHFAVLDLLACLATCFGNSTTYFPDIFPLQTCLVYGFHIYYSCFILLLWFPLGSSLNLNLLHNTISKSVLNHDWIIQIPAYIARNFSCINGPRPVTRFHSDVPP